MESKILKAQKNVKLDKIPVIAQSKKYKRNRSSTAYAH